MAILSIGMTTVDYLYKIDKFPNFANSQNKCTDSFVDIGGPVGRGVVFLNRVNADYKHIALIGSGTQAEILKSLCKNEGLNTEWFIGNENKSQNSSIILSENNRATFYDVPKYNNDSVENLGEYIRNNIYKYSLLYTDCNNLSILKILSKINKPKLIDTGGLKEDTLPYLYDMDYIIVPEYFTDAFINYKNLSKCNSAEEEVLCCFNELKPKLFTLTLGEKGGLYTTDGKTVHKYEANKPKNIVDTCGCGDIFHSCFAWCLDNGFDIEKCHNISAAAASVHALDMGNKSTPNFSQMQKFL